MRSFCAATIIALPLAACGTATVDVSTSGEAAGPGQSSWQQATIAGMGTRLYVPAGAAPANGRGLMVVLHGCSQQNSAIGDNGNWGATADRYQWVVAAPNAPGGGVIAGCWDYYGSGHTRGNKFNDDVLALVQDLLSRADLAIDPDQVYVSGLSSGAGQAMVLGCLAPDVFAGVGLNAGPTIGTSSGQISRVATSQSAAVSLCRRFAGSNASHFATQLTSVVHGDNDFTVAVGYNDLNARVMADIYGASSASTFSTSNLPGANPAGSGFQFDDAQGPRVRRIENTGLGHNWPSGAGGSLPAPFVSANSIDYPEELASFFTTHNRRTGGAPPPPPTDAGVSAPDAGASAPDAGPPPPVGVTATLTQHIQAGRLQWADYGTYYLLYGTAPFTLYPQPDGSWSDTPPAGGTPDAGTVPPDAGVTPPDAGFADAGFVDSGAAAPDAGVSAPDAGTGFACTSFTSSNYAHVQAGRGEVCNFGYVCTIGSGEQLGLYNTFFQSTVSETAAGYFVAGACP